jgi:glycosyltransferase involved in cell wall biosynthesis
VASNPTAVLLTARELDQGGLERDVAKIATHLDPSRFQPHVATFSAKGLRYEELKAARIPILELPLRSLVSFNCFRLGRELGQYISKHRIKVVHSYDASGVFMLPWARLAGVRVTIASQLSYRGILDARTQKLLRILDRLADAIVVNCEAIRHYMVEHEHVPTNRLQLCYNGVDTTEFFPGSPSVAADPDRVTIGLVCALRPEKNIPLLQEAFAALRGSRQNIQLVIVGSGPELGRAKANADRLTISDACEFVPATRDVADWLRRFDIFVLPSYSEAFSNSLLEAMACGCAAVASHIGGTPELLGTEEERGLLFNNNDAADLVRQLQRLVADRQLRRDLGHRAAAFAKEKLPIEAAARRTAEIYEYLLSRPPR